jgi:protein-tyrosine kinase
MSDKWEGPDVLLGEGPGYEGGVKSKAIGELIQDARNLSADDLDRIGRYQRENDLRFGEAAIALGLVAEAFRAIRSQILMRTQSETKAQRRPLAVVSPDSGDGKTYFCANLAVALAQLGGKVVVIDADMRGARLDQVFGVPGGTGLSGVLSGRGGKGIVKSVPGVPNLYVIPVGVQPPNPLELVEGPSFGMLLREVSIKFDHVIVDTPAAVYGSDGIVIASRCGSALVVTRKDANKVQKLQDMVASLQAGQVRLAGVIMNEL